MRRRARRRYNGVLMRFTQFAGFFQFLDTVRPASYHPLPARMTTVAHPGGET